MGLSAYIKAAARRAAMALATVACLLTATSCGWIDEDTADCSVKVRVTYDMNMKFADAFDSEVRRVTLYAFSEDGTLVYRKTDTRDNMPGGVMTLDGLDEGTYDLLVWAEGEERTAGSVEFGAAGEGTDARQGLTARLQRTATKPGYGEIAHDITALYHGEKAAQRLVLTPDNTPAATVNLTKNTNVIRITLQDYDGQQGIAPAEYTFAITDDNGLMASDNTMMADDSLTYRPWDVSQATTEATVDGQETTIAVAIAELTTGRLMTGKRPMLTVRNEEGDEIIRVPLIDYFLLVKGNYNRKMDDQEYLDRQDEYTMTFFLKGGRWVSSSILINSWRVVLSNADINQ